MKRRWMACLTMLLVILSAFPIYGESVEGIRLLDDANLLDSDEEEELLDAMDELIDVYDMDVAIVTLNNYSRYGYSMQNAANNLYYDSKYGISSDRDNGFLFVISMNDRDWYMKIVGDDANVAVNDYGFEFISERMVDKLKDDEYYEAFSLYLADLEDFLEAYDKGEPYGDDNQVRTPQRLLMYFGIAIGASLIVTIIIMSVLKSRMNTAKPQTGAREYVKDGSFVLTNSQDLYLYSRTTKTAIPKNNSSGGSGGGGRSSGSRGSGGGGGKF